MKYLVYLNIKEKKIEIEKLDPKEQKEWIKIENKKEEINKYTKYLCYC